MLEAARRQGAVLEPRKTEMRIALPIDQSNIKIRHFGEVTPYTDTSNNQKTDAKGAPIWNVPVVLVIPGERLPEGCAIRVPGTRPKIEQEAELRFDNLRVRLWSNNGGAGLTLAADAVHVVTSDNKTKAVSR